MVELAVERLALGSLRIVLLLVIFSTLVDTVTAAFDGAGGALLAVGVAIIGLALAGALRPHRAWELLHPRGRVALVAALFVLFGAFAPGFQDRYAQMPVACLSAVITSPAWVVVSVAILLGGMVVDPLAAGHSLAWAFGGPGRDALINEAVVLCAAATLTLGAISTLRRSLTGAPQSLAALRLGGPSLTPQLAMAATGTPAGLLGRADPLELTASLSVAERRVLALLTEGLAPKQAAHRLGVKLPTVRSQIASAKRKTGARTLEQLVGIYAEAEG